MNKKQLLNCRNCAWWTVIEGDMMEADYIKDCHETSVRNALSIGPYCPRKSVAWAPLPEEADLE